MTSFFLERVHFICIIHIISLYLFIRYREKKKLSYKLFRNELIPVFNPNEILVLPVRYFILFRSEMKIATG